MIPRQVHPRRRHQRGRARHHDIGSLSQSEESRERLYPDWDMEQVDADDLREVLGRG